MLAGCPSLTHIDSRPWTMSQITPYVAHCHSTPVAEVIYTLA